MPIASEAHNITMIPKKNQLELTLIGIFFIVLSLVGAVWTITSGLLSSGIDGILLLFVALLMAGVFALQLLLVALDAGWVKFPQKAAAKPVPAPAAAKAAPPASTQAK